MEIAEALAMAADNPKFPAWLRTACKDGAAEIDRRFGIGAELLIARRDRDELRKELEKRTAERDRPHSGDWMTVQDAERLAALWCAGQPLDDLPQWRTAIQVLTRELSDTRAALKKANDQAEHFERLWYLTNEDAGRYAFAKTLEGQVVTMETFKVRGAAELDQALDDAMAEDADAHNEAGYAA